MDLMHRTPRGFAFVPYEELELKPPPEERELLGHDDLHELKRHAEEVYGQKAYLHDPMTRSFLAYVLGIGRYSVGVRLAGRPRRRSRRDQLVAVCRWEGAELAPELFQALVGESRAAAAAVEAGRPRPSRRSRPSGLAYGG